MTSSGPAVLHKYKSYIRNTLGNSAQFVFLADTNFLDMTVSTCVESVL